MALDPGFTSGRPYLYALYTYDAAIGGTAPRWNDICPDPPGAERDGCVVSGRLSKILPDGSEQPLITDEWCQQYSSHSVGDLKFGPDGALYVTARRRRELHVRRLRPGRRAGQPVRRPARRRSAAR